MKLGVTFTSEIKALVDYLLAQTEVTDKVVDRVWGGVDFPPKSVNYTPANGPAVCLKARSGFDDYSDELRFPSMQLKCYGEDEVTADQLARVIHGQLQNAQTNEIFWARREQLPQLLREPETGWPFALAYYTMTVPNQT